MSRMLMINTAATTTMGAALAFSIPIAAGAMVGASLPAWLHLEFVIPLYLVGQAIAKLANPAQRRAIVAAATVALLALSAPLQLGVALAIAAGVTAGLTAEVPR